VQRRETETIYATLGRRVKASILDSVIVLALIVTIPVIMEQINEGLPEGWGVLMFAPLFFLEPLLISCWGQTVGQYVWGIKVVREADFRKCPLFLSFVRYYAKALLGWWSMIYMFFTKKHQAIHDHLAHTLVILSPYRLAKNPSFAEKGITEQELEKGFVYPSVLRRFVFFVIWWFISFIVLNSVAEELLSLSMEKERAHQILDSIDPLVTFFALILLLTVGFLAAKGLLPGARRRSQLPADSTTMGRDNQHGDDSQINP